MSVKNLFFFACLLFQNVNCFEKQSIGQNIRGNKEERKDPQAKKDENSRELMMKVRLHLTGEVQLGDFQRLSLQRSRLW